ncbi:hypothetical protein JOC85_002394 [Bacillus mesophilus]|uniref:YviE n=1 Tax=Bacillus mesophilus TaxID=1808955 RepID=A0A6M0Q9R9_9BACI|nr:DUF6470 family protein [Bacillus mesophilus]MBM7661591.1 hypothetical protein [Bacillus mesophilus]NEY72260.1 hypothetical protein [Bacillus mesophilus]
MQIPKIQIQSTRAQLGIRTHHAKVDIQQPKAEMNIQQPSADLNITSTPSKLTIDQTQAREDVDLKSIAKRIQEFAQQGKQDSLKGIARRATEGDQLMRVENKGNAIARIAKQNSIKEHQFNIAWIPSHDSVKINYTPKKVNIQVEAKKPIIEVQPNKPILNYSPGKVEYMMESYPRLQIDFVN